MTSPTISSSPPTQSLPHYFFLTSPTIPPPPSPSPQSLPHHHLPHNPSPTITSPTIPPPPSPPPQSLPHHPFPTSPTITLSPFLLHLPITPPSSLPPSLSHLPLHHVLAVLLQKITLRSYQHLDTLFFPGYHKEGEYKADNDVHTCSP